jgi:triacylglycerol lipase
MRRTILAGLAFGSALLIPGCANLLTAETSHPPILFVHGAFGNQSLWMTTQWRFESEGWPRDRLFAMDVTNPRPRNDDAKPQPGRTGSAEHAAQLAQEVERIRNLTGARKVVIVANSRGGLALRDYVTNGAGAATVSHAVMGGTPNHGLWRGDFAPGHESHADGPYMKALNAPQGPDRLEVMPGVAFMTLRSDRLDKFTQPDGRWIGQPQLKTGVTHDAPALRGAENIVLPGADHFEVSYGPEAFRHTYRFITGRPPARTDVLPQSAAVLDGKVTGLLEDGTPTNLPIPNAHVEVYRVSPESGERLEGPLHTKVVAADGRWGPFSGRPEASYEFVVSAPGYATTHIFRSPFPRSSNLVLLRPARLGSNDRGAKSVVVMQRPRGFLALGRDRMSFDAKDPPGIGPDIPGDNSSTLRLNEFAMRSVAAEVNGERIVVRTWPASENRLVRAEFHY